MSYDNSPPQRLTWRLKADVQERILITTGHAQGVWVADLDTNEPLWSLPQEVCVSMRWLLAREKASVDVIDVRSS
jgi:hypothetical protein